MGQLNRLLKMAAPESTSSIQEGVCYSTNYRAEAVALKTGAAHFENSTKATQNVVFFSDALSVLQALQSGKEKELNDLFTALSSLCKRHHVTLQWIPSHCDVQGNEKADTLAKEGSTKEQVDKSTTLRETKTAIKAKQQSMWLQRHPQHNKRDPYHLLTRQEQVIIFRLRTGHSRLKGHLFHRLHIGESALCPCGAANQTPEHLLQDCNLHTNLRFECWRETTPLATKLNGGLEDLRCTVAFVKKTGVSV